MLQLLTTRSKALKIPCLYLADSSKFQRSIKSKFFHKAIDVIKPFKGKYHTDSDGFQLYCKSEFPEVIYALISMEHYNVGGGVVTKYFRQQICNEVPIFHIIAK